MEKYLNIFIISVFVFYTAACGEQKRKDVGNTSKNMVDTSLRRCMPANDTIFNGANAVHYVVIDSFFALNIKVSSYDTLLPYRFNCRQPMGLVPVVDDYYNNEMCLKRGYGFDYREFIVLFVKDHRLIVKGYETALAANLKKGIVAYRIYDQLEKIVIEEYRTGVQKIFILPGDLAMSRISTAELINDRLYLTFSDNRKINYSLK